MRDFPTNHWLSGLFWAALLGAIAASGLVACGGDGSGTRSLDGCLDGSCECVFNVDCPGGLLCIDGHCGALDRRDDVVGGGDTESQDTDVADASGDTQTDEDSATSPDSDAELDTVGPSDVGDVGDGAASSGALGAFCTTNGACLSGWCLDSPEGGYCSLRCEEGCPDGWVCRVVSGVTDPVNLCVEDRSRLCQPCEIDTQCGAAGTNRCLDVGGGKFCSRDCSTGPCPQGYRCETRQLSRDGQAALNVQQCVPDNGTCDCSEISEGLVKACTNSNAEGTCFGEATCAPELGFVGCTAQTPAAEICNGLDDNCDGQTDEGQSPVACVQSNDYGSCPGTQTCQGSSGLVCTAQIPTAELCNGLDDDCNGATDEDFLVDVDGVPTIATTEHCGACGQNCGDKFDHSAAVACDISDLEAGPTCRIVSCEAGFILFNGTSCINENATLCNPCQSDDDCFGEASRCLQISDTDPRTFCGRDCSGEGETTGTCPGSYECVADGSGGGASSQCMPATGSCDCTAANAGQLKACSRDNVVGTCFGQEICDPAAGWVECSAATPTDEICNGEDDDCDGEVDEGVAVGAACVVENEAGSCDGVTACVGAAGVQCSARTPAEEVCDGVDNDCDGVVDEGFGTTVTVDGVEVVKYDRVDHCGACGYACPEVPHGAARCDASGATPVCAVESCEAGFFSHLNIACLPVPQGNSCNACGVDADCQGPEDRCVIEGSGRGSCAIDCSADSIYGTESSPCTGEVGAQGCCPDNYSCVAAAGGQLCRPLSDDCGCVEDGAVETCSRGSAFGTCQGVRTCQISVGGAGFTACSAQVPTAEVCDGADNDCDGAIDAADDGLDFGTSPTGGESCDNGPGCLGSWQCGQGSWTCSAQAATDEICDGVDNDCDGVDDNGFVDAQGRYVDAAHCGACGLNCAQLVSGATGTDCVVLDGAPTCIATGCDDGLFAFDAGRICLTLPDNQCNACTGDDDCLVPSSRCVDLGGGGASEKVCARSCAADSPYGVDCPAGYGCDGGVCVPSSGTCQCGPTTAGVQRACPVGACTGLQTCVVSGGGGDFAFTECSAEGFIPEVCDGQDNDCDGLTDEGFVGSGGVYDTDESCGACGNNCLLRWSAEVHHALGRCGSGAGAPECVIDRCTTESEGGASYEWVDINGLDADGCECRRLSGNTDTDWPDEEFGGPPEVDAVYVDANCDGIDGVIGDALFVRAGSAGGDGSLGAPFGSLGEGLAAFSGSGKRYLLVAGGDYAENITLTPGVNLHGGYSPDFLRRNIVTFETRISGAEPDYSGTPIPGTVFISGITGTPTVFSGFTVRGYDVSTVPGAGAGYATYAIYILNSGPGLKIINSRIEGGVGGAGATGENGTAGFGVTSSGGAALNGANGQDVEASGTACTGDDCNGAHRDGGAAGANAQCAGANGIAGGEATCPVFGGASWVPPVAGLDGAPGYSWTRDSGSNSACSGHLTEADFPDAIKKLDGFSGSPGADGAGGLQGSGCGAVFGTFVGGAWVGDEGHAGSVGVFGQRGGAGAPSGGIATATATEMPAGVGAAGGADTYKLGASGGGAGAGGCGGSGGAGGGSGGASIGILVAWDDVSGISAGPELRDNIVARGFGGTGGTGGYGGTGGLGGVGGVGGDSNGFWVGFRAGDGGRGGFGGEGGGGGGGCGGASLGIVSVGGPSAWSDAYAADNAFSLGDGVQTGGPGGATGPSGTANPGGDGAVGASTNIYRP